MTQQYLLLVFGYLYICGLIGMICVYSFAEDPKNRKHNLYSLWPMLIGLLGFIIVALLVG